MTAVSGSWIVPTVTGPSSGTTDSSVWVGIDGYGNSTVEQVGTEEDVVNGQPRLSRMVGDVLDRQGPARAGHHQHDGHAGRFDHGLGPIHHQRHLRRSILPVDRRQQPGERFFQHLCKLFSNQSPLAQRSCAEWIVEAPTVGGSIATLPNFGSVTFTNASAVINGVSGPINAASWQSQALNIGSNGVTYDTTSVLTNSGTSFVVTYNSSAGAAVRAGTNAAAGTASGAAVGTTLRSGKTIAGPVLRGSAWTGASVVSGFRTPIRQPKRPTQGFLIDPLWN